MNALELGSAYDQIQQEIDAVVVDQGNHTELSYVLRGLPQDKIRALLAHIIELRAMRQPITYEFLDSAIGDEEEIE